MEFGDVVIRDNKCYGEGSVSLVAYDPYFYIEEAKIFEGDKKSLIQMRAKAMPLYN